MKRSGVTSLAILAAAALAAPARAGDADDLQGLLEQSVISTASRSAETTSDAPATATTLTAEDLRRYNIRSISEAINFLGMGMITTSSPNATDIGARGVMLAGDSGNHVLLLIDGHAVNEPLNGTAYFDRGAGIPLELVDHIEVILGPGAVLYGAQAMFGVINIVTKQAKDFRGLHLSLESELPISVRGAAGGGVEFDLLGKKAGLTVMGEVYGQRGPAESFKPERFSSGSFTGTWGGVADKSDYAHVESMYARLVRGDVEVALRAAQYARGMPTIDERYDPTADFNNPDNRERDRWLSLDVKYRAALSSMVDLRARVYGDLYDYQWRVTNSASGACWLPHSGCAANVDHIDGASRWAGAEVQSALDWLEDGSLVTLLGVDGRLRDVEIASGTWSAASNAELPGDVLSHSVTDGTVALYLQQTWTPLRWLGLNAGARADYTTTLGAKVSPRAAVRAIPWRGGTAKLMYAEAFREASAFERLFHNETQLAAPDLGPETVRSIEGAFEQRFGAHRLQLDVFHSEWSHMVLLRALSPAALSAAVMRGQLPAGTGAASINTNLATIRSTGADLGVEGSALTGRLRYALHATASYSRYDDGTGDGGDPPTVGPQLFGNARVAYDLGGRLPTVALAGQLLDRRPASRAFDHGFTPAPFAPALVVLRLAVTGAAPLLEGVSYRLGADWASAGTTSYVVGPVQTGTPSQPSAELAPVDRFRVFVGFNYELR